MIAASAAGPRLQRLTTACFPGDALDLSGCRALAHVGRGFCSESPNLDAAALPPSVVTLGDTAFAEQSAAHVDLAGAISLVVIGSHFCFGNTNLLTVTLPAGLRSLGPAALVGAAMLRAIDLSQLTFLKSIPDQFAKDASALTAVTFPPNAATVGVQALAGCAALRRLDLSTADGSLAAIGGSFCKGGRRLRDVVLPLALEAIGDCAFAECRQLRAARVNLAALTARRAVGLNFGVVGALLPTDTGAPWGAGAHPVPSP